MKIPRHVYALATIAALACGTRPAFEARAQEAPVIPAPAFTSGGYDPDAGIAYFEYTGFVPGAYYMIGVQYDSLDATNQFDPWSDPFQASDTSLVFVTDDPSYSQIAFYIIAPFELPQSTFNFSDFDTITNSYTFTATASTNILYNQRKLYLGDDTYSTLLTEGMLTNVLFATFNTQNRPNGYYYVDENFVLPGIQKIRGWETISYYKEGYVDIENPFFAYYPPTYVSGLGAPNWTFFGTPGNAYTVTLSSVSADNTTTNVLATAEVGTDTTTTNGGGFSVGWDAANDDGGPLYLLSVADNGTNNPPSTNIVFQLLSGSFHCEPYCSWLHTEEAFNVWPYQGAYGTAFGLHSGTADLLSILYETDWGDNYAITQTKHPISPDPIASQDAVTNLLWFLNVTNAAPYSEWYVSEFTAFGHMNPEGVFGGPGSPLTDGDGFEYTDLAAARGTILDTNRSNSAYIMSTKGAFKCMMLEGCESAGEDQLLFKAGGIPREDDPSAYPTWGMGFWSSVPVFRTSGAIGFCEDSTREWVSDYAPTAMDAVMSKVNWYPVTAFFAELFGCLNSQYTLGSVSTDRGYHNGGTVGGPMFDAIVMDDTSTTASQSRSSTQSLRSSGTSYLTRTLSPAAPPTSKSDFLSAPRREAPSALNSLSAGSPTAASTSARALRTSSASTLATMPHVGPKLAPGIWATTAFRSAIAPIRAEAQARRAQLPPTVTPEVLQAVVAGQDYYLSDPPPMPPVAIRINGVLQFVPWEEVYGPVPPIRIPISDERRAAALLSIQRK